MREVLHGMLQADEPRARIVACQALRETPDVASIPALCAALDDVGLVYDLWSVERVSNLAALGLAALAEGRAHPALARWLDARRMELSAEDRTTRHLAVMVLAELGDPRAIDAARRERDCDDTFGEYADLLGRIEAKGTSPA
jgi:HEAT repeat protein